MVGGGRRWWWRPLRRWKRWMMRRGSRRWLPWLPETTAAATDDARGVTDSWQSYHALIHLYGYLRTAEYRLYRHVSLPVLRTYLCYLVRIAR